MRTRFFRSLQVFFPAVNKMGKRKHSDQDGYEYIIKKLRKLEKRVKRSKKKRRDSSTSSDSHNSVASPKNLEDGSMVELESIYVDNDVTAVDLETTNDECRPASVVNISRPERECSPIASTSKAALASTSVEPQPGIESQSIEAPQSQTNTSPCEEPMDKIMLELLGDDPSVTKSYGNEINSGLAVRIQHMVTNGLSKDTRKELQTKYLPPSNCTFVDAPTLNPEIKAAVSETVLKRDKGIELKQKLLGSAITCIGEAISKLLAVEDKNTELIKLLMDACRIICDCQNTDSVTRRNFILYNLKKEMRDQLQKSKIDTSLFGADLAENIKTARNISKSGAELKSAPPPKPAATKFTKQTPVSTPQRNLNWKAPPQNRRPKGTQEPKEPAQRSQPASSSRPSYRAPPPKNRNRR
ncbi:uncharacterized protein LOC135088368 [Ostrinia nubilalis]|uniref:uncharacterized protein LOC135088368 n=1 Tax=Ostrinia nubilalis TaxID=29057 RepID=UPI0030823B76